MPNHPTAAPIDDDGATWDCYENAEPAKAGSLFSDVQVTTFQIGVAAHSIRWRCERRSGRQSVSSRGPRPREPASQWRRPRKQSKYAGADACSGLLAEADSSPGSAAARFVRSRPVPYRTDERSDFVRFVRSLATSRPRLRWPSHRKTSVKNTILPCDKLHNGPAELH